MRASRDNLILVSGATGYVGGRLVPILLELNYKVRCLVRDTSNIEGRKWNGIQIVCGDALEYETLLPAMQNVGIAYYLIHSMAGGAGFRELDLIAAGNFGRAAREAGVKRIIYLGGLGVENGRLSPHLKSRQQTGDCLREFGVPVTEFRAAQIIGSGSASFELIRNMAERVPFLIVSKATKTRSQPIAIRNVLRYLTECLEIPQTEGEIIEIGGSEILSYQDMMRKYAEIRGLKRPLLELPFISPRFCALVADLVTPIPRSVARFLMEGLKNEVIVHNDKARKLFKFTPLSYEEAVRLALIRIQKGKVVTTWQDAYSSLGKKMSKPVKLSSAEGLIMEKRQLTACSDSATAFKVISCFGGERGWFYADYLWHLRGLLDRLFGGVGLRRVRRSFTELRVGDTFGFWRVEELVENQLLRLRSEMKMRSGAWLQFEIEQIEDAKVLVTQTAFYEPKGLLGLMYWFVLYPMHKIIFRGMIRTMVRYVEHSYRE
jgi:uncharacterized protein YbjT (DUF2867 family)